MSKYHGKPCEKCEKLGLEFCKCPTSTRLYGVDYREAQPTLESVEVVKETAKMYYFDSRKWTSWLGYVTQLSKEDKRVHLTPESALEAALATQDDAIDSVLDRLRILRFRKASLLKLLEEYTEE